MRHRLFARPADALPPLVLLLALLVGGYFWWQVDIVNAEAEHRARQDAALRAAQLADAMAGQVSSLFGTMDLGLLHVRDAWMRDPALVPRTAKAVLATFPEGVITHLSIAESEGYTVYSTVEGSPRTYVGDRVHFRSQQTGVDRMFIGRPVQSRLIPGWSFIVNRPVLRDGRFAGTVNLSIRADAMAALLGRVRLNSQDLVALVQADGTFQARSLDNLEAMGKAVAADRPFLAADAPDRGHFHRPGTLDSVARIYAWQRLPDAKLIVLVGLDEAALLAPLRKEREADRRTAALMSGLLGLAGLLLAAVLARMQSQGRQLREDNLRRQQAEAELASSHAQLELRVARRTAELTQQLQRNASVLSTAIDGFFAADLSGCIRQANPAFCAMLDYEEAELLGMRIPDVEAAETPEETAIHIEKVLAQGHNRFDTRHRRKDGSTLEVEVSVSLVRPGGEPMLYAFVRDIGPRKAAEEMLRQARDEAERANAAKSHFLSRMSHELRTPLNAVLGFAQVLQMPGGPPLSTLQAGHVLQIRNAGEHLLQLVNEVLDLARIESGRLDINAVPVALQPAIERCVAQIEGLAQARRIEVKLPPGDSCTVLADPLRLQQVLLNLLSNAVKYNREGGSIELACAPVAGQRVRVSVRDDGRGLNAEQQARLFRPFERLQAAHSGIEGTGIGLALAKHLVHSMQGDIGVESVPGEGSTFWFELPLCHLPSPSPRPADVPAAGVGASPRSGKRTVLYVEDDPANLRLVQKFLNKRADIELLAASNADDGLVLAARSRPDLILLDINLPGVDGFATLQRLRADPATQTTPVIAVTSNAMTRDMECGWAAGFTDTMTMPLDVARFMNSVNRCLAGDKA